jgi:hypothetical protein
MATDVADTSKNWNEWYDEEGDYKSRHTIPAGATVKILVVKAAGRPVTLAAVSGNSLPTLQTWHSVTNGQVLVQPVTRNTQLSVHLGLGEDVEPLDRRARPFPDRREMCFEGGTILQVAIQLAPFPGGPGGFSDPAF